MNTYEFRLQINGNIGLPDAVEFLDKENVKLVYNGQEVPKIKTYDGWMDENYYLSKSLEWIRKAKSEKDGFNKFFALWVGYNAFYNQFHSREGESNQGERNKAKATSRLLLDDEQKILLKELIIQEFLSSLVNGKYRVFVITRNGRKNCVAEFERSYDSCQSDNWQDVELIKRAFDDLLDLLYGIRCNLFHGNKSLSDPGQNHLLELAYNVLLNVFSFMLIKYLIKYKH